MTAMLALPSLLPGRLCEQGLVLPPDLSFEDWSAALHNAEWIERASSWWVVDLVAYGERFGEDASQALPTFEDDPEGVRQARLKQAGWMATVWPAGTRVPGQSYTAHRAVAKLDRADAVALLNEKDADGRRLSTRELARRADEIEAAIPLTAAPSCAADAPWPTLDDLLPEWRAKAEASGHPVAYMTALVDVAAEACFAPGRWRD